MDRRGVEESGEGEGGGGAWTYLDDMNVPQGPFKSSEVVTWINSGHFDGRGSALFRREFEDASYRPLNECLSKLMQDEFKEARRRVANIHQTSTQNVAKEGLRDSTDGSEKKFGTDALNQLPITRERGFGQSVFDLGMMGSASNKPLDSEMLDWTSDIDIVLVPSKVLWQIEAQRFNPRRRSLQIGPLGALAKEEPVRGGCPIETFSALVDRPSRLVVSKLTAADADRDKQDLLLDSEEAVWRDEVKIPSRIIIVPAHSSLLKSASPLLLREIIKLEEQIR